MGSGFNPKAYLPKGESVAGKKTRKRKLPWWWLGVCLVFLSGLLSGFYLDWRYKGDWHELRQLRRENAELEKKIKKLQEDPTYYEEIARQKYGYVKKNERLIIFGR